MKNSVFGHLVHRFASHPENLATEALAYILARSPIATESLVKFFGSTGASIPANLHFRTQAGDVDKAIPDLVGVSTENQQVVICEMKFWAGLTDNQPVTYLKRSPILLIFVSPAKRIPTLWFELLSRCKFAGIDPEIVPQASSEMMVAKTTDIQFIAVASWRTILDTLQSALSSHGDMETVSDVVQLRGLCDQMDAEAFLPVRSEELAPEIAVRILQFNDVVDAVTELLVKNGVASTSGFRATPIRDGYGRYMRINEFGCMLQVNSRYWSTLRETPIWLDIKRIPPSGGYWVYSPDAKDRLAPLEREFPPRLIKQEDSLLVPLRIPLGVERDEFIKLVYDEISQVFQLLNTK